MSNTLFGTTPQDTYQALIKVGNNTALSGAKKVLSDGLGTDLPIEVSTTEINFTGLLKQSGVSVPTAAEVNSKQAILVSGTNIKTINGSSILGSGDLVINTSVAWGGITGSISAQTDLQNALNSKVDSNTAIVGATKTKVTYDAKGLVTAGADATTNDIADSLNKRYVSDAQLTVLTNTSGTNSGDNAVNTLYSGLEASKQDTLVSGTNLKTVNGSSLLGSGDLVVSASPSGLSGAVQFSNGSAFDSDVNSFKWDNSQKMLGLGVGVFPPSARLTSVGFGLTSSTLSFKTQNGNGSKSASFDDNGSFLVTGRLGVGAVSSTASALFKGTGTTGSTQSFRAENSVNTNSIIFSDLGQLVFYNGATQKMNIDARNSTFRFDSSTAFALGSGAVGIQYATGIPNANGLIHTIGPNESHTFYKLIQVDGGISANTYFTMTLNDGGGTYSNTYKMLEVIPTVILSGAGAKNVVGYNFKPILTTTANTRIFGAVFETGDMLIGGAATSGNASASLEMISTTKGLLPPRMNTAQKVAIVTPAAGLVVYDTTTNKLCCYDGTIWNDLF